MTHHAVFSLVLLLAAIASTVDAGTSKTNAPSVLVTRPVNPSTTPDLTPSPTSSIDDVISSSPTPPPTLLDTSSPTPSPTLLDTSSPTPPPTLLDTSSPTPSPTLLDTLSPTPPPTLLDTSSPTPPPTLLDTSSPTPPPTSPDADTGNGMGHSNTACTREQCEQRAIELNKTFYSDIFPSKGCYSKNQNAFYSPGTQEEMETEDMPGIQERIWC